MSRIYDNSWFRGMLLLGAMGAGVALTQLIPSYEEIAAHREKSAPAAANRKVDTPTYETSGVTGIDVDLRHLRLLSCIA
jgi:hypothetical protein